MPELVSLSEAARRLQVSRQAMSKWQTEEQDFPATVVRGRSLLVDWLEVRHWVQARRRDQAVADRARQRDAEFKRLHGLLWRQARWLFTPSDLSIVLSDCFTVADLRARARELGIRLP